jgi:pilus assembly protein Flp/PilA
MLNKIQNLVVQEEGQGMTEYGLLLAVVVVVVVAALTIFQETIESLFRTVTEKINEAIGATPKV